MKEFLERLLASAALDDALDASDATDRESFEVVGEAYDRYCEALDAHLNAELLDLLLTSGE
jgi:hypothetical protein